MTKDSAKLRRRKGAASATDIQALQNNAGKGKPENSAEKITTESAKSVIKRHPLFYALIFVGFPYAFSVLYRWFRLQNPLPEYMRPAVRTNDLRQALILGSMSSGTSSLANQLGRILEVGHEDSDAAWKFVRDGTVSWFHGIRFWPSNELFRINQLCQVQWRIYKSNALRDNYGFGATLFGTPEYNCSWWEQSPSIPKSCHQHACRKALEAEYACAEKQSCHTPYQSVIVQSREPWKIVASLTAKYCFKSNEIQPRMPNNLQWLFVALGVTETSELANHCVIQMVDYVYLYYSYMLKAGLKIYKVEDTPMTTNAADCVWMERIGLADVRTTVYPPNHDLYNTLCGVSISADKSEISKKINVINKGRVTLDMLLMHVSDASVSKMNSLYQKLDYSSLISEAPE